MVGWCLSHVFWNQFISVIWVVGWCLSHVFWNQFISVIWVVGWCLSRVLESIHKCDMGGWLMFITVVFWNQFISVIWVVGWCLSPLCSGINHHYFFMNNWKSGLDPSVWFLITLLTVTQPFIAQTLICFVIEWKSISNDLTWICFQSVHTLLPLLIATDDINLLVMWQAVSPKFSPPNFLGVLIFSNIPCLHWHLT